MQFGPYLLLERISVGGMAEVYKAKEYGVEGFERTVAVKRILPHVAEDDEFIAMFKDEAKIAVQLNHGNIAQIYNLGNEQDSFYIALEYINGRDLRAIFQKCQQQAKPMPVAQACYVIMKICEGLDYAHNKKDKYNRELNIVHRDVSPPNILVSFEGEVKLIDFGVAKAAGRASRTQAGILKGKFGYMSPEQVRGMPLDRRSDVFSVGVVLFEVLTGNRLFQADTDFATLEKVRAVDVPRPASLNPDIPKPLENIIYKALAREPEQRYQSGIELHDELQAFMFAQGLFYSRKDLAGWMRQQYAREIELEKEKNAAPSPPPPAEAGRRKTIMMPPGSGPPPPPGAAARKPPPVPTPSGGPPPPPPRGATPAPRNTAPQTPVSAAATDEDSDLRPRKAVKRKTMVMTTARPNLPPPPGGGGPPKPRPRPAPAASGGGGGGGAPAVAMPAVTAGAPAVVARDASAEPPTIPLAPALPRPNGAGRSKPTQSYAATGVAPNSDFDWDDDELETRLFEDDKNAPAPAAANRPGPPRGADRPGQVGGELDTAIDIDVSEPPTIAAGGSVTVVPGAVQVSPGLTMVPSAAPQMVPPPTHNPFAPQAPMPFAPMPAAPQMGGTQAMPVVPQHMQPHMQQAQMVAPPHMQMQPQMSSQYDFDDRPRKSSAGLVVGILAAALALVAAGFGGVWLYSRNKTGGSTTATAEGQAPSQAVARSGLTIQTTPADVQLSIDGQAIAGSSPFVVSDLAPGKHKVTIARDGFLPIEREIDLGAGGLSLPLTLEHRDVTLLLESDPPGAAMNLLVGGRAYAMGPGGTQYKLTRDAAAKYEVEATALGYLTTRIDLPFTGEQTQKVRVTLARDNNATAGVAVPTTPTTPVDAGTPPTTPGTGVTPTTPATTPSTPPSTPPATPPSTPSTRPSKPKPPKQPTPPKPTAAKTSTLRIGTNAGVAPAQVFVDGKLVGTTPIGGLKVSPGKHKVKWKWPDGREVTTSVDVADGEMKTIKNG
ncbi:MAG TPA: protein kinase [Nannocystaceae bacterium]|nr:protein kinase [Nannocystaceae bacterium]